MATELDSIITLAITFLCPNGHPITREFTHLQQKGAMRLIDEQSFDGLKCAECGWAGKKLGSERADIRVVSNPCP